MRAMKLAKPQKDRTHDIVLTPKEAKDLADCDPSTIDRLQLLLKRVKKAPKK